mgnify:CR=1 FL=1
MRVVSILTTLIRFYVFMLNVSVVRQRLYLKFLTTAE